MTDGVNAWAELMKSGVVSDPMAFNIHYQELASGGLLGTPTGLSGVPLADGSFGSESKEYLNAVGKGIRCMVSATSDGGMPVETAKSFCKGLGL